MECDLQSDASFGLCCCCCCCGGGGGGGGAHDGWHAVALTRRALPAGCRAGGAGCLDDNALAAHDPGLGCGEA